MWFETLALDPDHFDRRTVSAKVLIFPILIFVVCTITQYCAISEGNDNFVKFAGKENEKIYNIRLCSYTYIYIYT